MHVKLVRCTLPCAVPPLLRALGDQYGLHLGVHEREKPAVPAMRYYASFDEVEIAEGQSQRLFSSPSGNGATPAEALRDYARRLAGHELTLNAMTPRERKILVPGAL